MQGQCPNCKGLFEIKEEWIGLKAPCPHCQQTITLLAMPTTDSPAASSINLDKGDSTTVNASTETPEDTVPAPAYSPQDAAQDPQPPAGGTPVSYQQPVQYPDGPQLASIFERILAMIIDGFILGIVTTIISIVICLFGSMIVGAISAATENDALAMVVSILINLFVSLITTAIGFCYEGYFLSTSGATIGKKVMGLRVEHAGQNPTFLRGGCRYLARGLSFMICMIGYIMACFTEDNKALHDMICDTIVVKGN